MANASFEKYGNAEFLEHETGKYAGFVEKQGGPVDPYGDVEKKKKGTMDMNAGKAFNEKDLSKIDAMGTEAAKKGNKGQKSDNKGDHFKTDTDNADIDPMGTDCGKTSSGQSRH